MVFIIPARFLVIHVFCYILAYVFKGFAHLLQVLYIYIKRVTGVQSLKNR